MNAPLPIDEAGAPMPRAPFPIEPTAVGMQSLVPGVAPISAAQRLTRLAAAPLAPGKPQRACDLGLSDLAARGQLDLFQPREP